MRLRQVTLCQVAHVSASVRQPWWSRRLFAFLLAFLVSLFAATSALAQFIASAPAPTNLSATPSTGQVALAWSPSTSGFPAPPDHAPLDGGPSYSNYYYYYIYRSTSSGGEGGTPLYKVPQATAQPNGASTATYTDSRAVNGVTYYYQVTAVTISAVSGSDPTATGGPESARSNEANALPLVRINGGGADYTDGAGKLWNGDRDFTGGAPINTTAAITGTADPTLYQAQRSGAQFSYAEPVANGTYILSLLFAEVQGNTTGQRTFNVNANGTQILTNYDIYQDAGGANKAIIKTFPVTVTNGQFSLALAGVTGNAALAAFSLLPIKPAADIPPPGWAMDVIPTDSGSEVGGAGPGSSMQISLPSGVEENTPGPDLSAYNPVGPSVSYERTYRSTLSAQGYGSPGLSPGWVDNYDLRITSGSGAYTLNYPNGAAETWTGTTGRLGTPPGAPYLATAPSAGVLTMTFRDRSVYTFTQIANTSVNYPAGTYLLSGIKNLVGHSVTLNRDTANNNYRILSITNDAVSPVTLLQFNYNGVNLLSVQDLASQTLQAANEHREVGYKFTGGALSSVSQIAPLGQSSGANDLWRYGYQTLNGQPYLNSVSTPSPSDASGATYATAVATYDATGLVTSHTDAGKRKRAYAYGIGQVQVKVYNQAGDATPVQQWSQKFGPGAGKNVDTGFTDAASHVVSVKYAGTPSPYLPSAVTNRNLQTTSVTYDPANAYGNVTTVTDARGIQVTSTYQYPPDFPLGQVASVQRNHVTPGGTTDSTQAATTYVYYTAADSSSDGVTGVLNGLVKQTLSPQPGTVNASPSMLTQYAYDALGNVTQTTTPGPNGTTTVTYNYTAGYNGYTQPEALGEPLSVTVSGLSSDSTTTTTVTYFKYDGRGNRVAAIDALGNETDMSFTLADQPLRTTYPATGQSGGQAHTDTVYEYVGGPASSVSVYDEGNNPTSAVRRTINAYGLEGELLQVSDLKGPITSYRYDGEGRVSDVFDGLNQQTHYDFDAIGNLSRVSYPRASNGSDTISYGYDADQNMIQRIDGNGVETDYQRYDPSTQTSDPDNLVRTIHYVYPSGYNGVPIADVGFTYDTYARRASMSDGTGSQNYTYDDLDDLLTKTVNFTNGPTGLAMVYAYNNDGSCSQLTVPLTYYVAYPSTGSVYYSYDGLGRPVETDYPWGALGGMTTHTYQANGWLQQTQQYYNSTYYGQYIPFSQTTYTHNARGFLTGLENDIISGSGNVSGLSNFTGMTYDAVGNRTSEAAAIPTINGLPAADRTLQYTYDTRDELLTEASASTDATDNYNQNYNWGFSYDLASNPTTFRSAGAGFNTDNQNGSIGYDGNGDPATVQGRTSAFDPEDRLSSFLLPSPFTGNWKAAYNGDGQTVWQNPSSLGPSFGTLYRLYDGDQPLLELNSDGTVRAGWGWGADGLRSRYFFDTSREATQGSSTDDQVYFYTYDPQGNLCQTLSVYDNISNYTGVATTTAYDAFGTQRGEADTTPSRLSYRRYLDGVGFGGQWGYEGNVYTRLHHLGARYYDTTAGRFVTRDPIGYKGGINLYGFTGNNPVNEMDPSGLDPSDKRSVGRKVHDWFFGRADSPLAHANHGVQEIYDIDGVEEQDKLDRRIGAGMAQGMKQGTSIYAQAVGGAIGGGEGKAAEELEGGLTASKVRFPFLKDHALRHGEGLSPADYLQDAINNVNAGRRFLVRHNRSQKLVFLKRTGFDEFQFTSTSLNRRTIFTNFKVNSEYLRNKGITLPKDF